VRTALLMLLLAGAPLAAADSIELSATIPWIDQDGYTPVVVEARADRDAVLRITAEQGRAHATTAVAVAAGVAVRRTLLIPPAAVTGSYIGVRWTSDGAGTGGSEGQTYANAQFGPDDADVVMLDPSEALPLADLARRLEGQVSLRQRYGTAGSFTLTRIRRLAAEALPDRWQGWPTWLTLIATTEGEAALDGDQRRAIADWTRAGGALFVASGAQVAGWRALGVEPTVLGLARGDAGAVMDDAAVAGLATRLNATQEDRLVVADAHKVPGTERAPIGGFVIVGALFALLVGPVNLWWVRRRDARHLFLITTPLLSLATCAGLLTYNLIAEGVALRRSARQIAVVDQPRGRAAIWTAATYFGGFAGGDIALDPEAKLLPFEPGRGDRWNHRYQQQRDLAAYGLDWSDGQLATGGWIPARINRHLAYAELRPLGDRLIVARDGAGWSATNGFAATMTALRWRDAQGRWWGCDAALAPGARGALALQPTTLVWMEPGGQLLQEVRADAGAAAMRACADAAGRPYAASATLDGALTPLPGPTAEDAKPVSTLLLTIAPPE